MIFQSTHVYYDVHVTVSTCNTRSIYEKIDEHLCSIERGIQEQSRLCMYTWPSNIPLLLRMQQLY